ncbi:tRNA (adenosine(37)-N6)-threonylcarbamoyltransferase complex dimerization subunit type 1 TsaB [Acuticoccus sp. M5D2P5]|uniref:tRNA (adenosine(37)-N6)-threonylcarbamoyltransferase complex dimerization subunit type 1 TsaB n=1 Tax=Acuticoccus kalidii TaxID=2910977 RepID=UPI001F43EFA3|nr:tRNA (adenosine(37)-N6)-threonylcarbamoyltransferase complex dimerization subunit type 1 TsaB [Acuticoccus kalidii]MCF3936413.1 tRNA (adenosine(37)-N6)-threonylcarbamoyltransferase complex dimerization subunit type 1 TsaB [Acuticoccus kalidii]
MRVLALDTALDHVQAALISLPDVDTADAAILGVSRAAAKGDAEAIVDHANAALAMAGAAYGDIDHIAVTVGPGSFTGVRVGIAFAKGIAFARAVPASGVPTLEVLAREARAAGPGSVLAVVDARHDAVFAALYVEGSDEASLMARIPVAEARVTAHAARARIVGPASGVAAMGEGEVIDALDLVALAEAGVARKARPVSALYLAPVDAAPQRHKSLARA